MKVAALAASYRLFRSTSSLRSAEVRVFSWPTRAGISTIEFLELILYLKNYAIGAKDWGFIWRIKVLMKDLKLEIEPSKRTSITCGPGLKVRARKRQ